ncbi:MAG: WecB/TagA/CpsF family glycosyltransferase [Clostridia bacterium]|nr:WecB/TagA/CpsF family glycosyltransferase [Clostridia bacterium]
MQSSIFGVRAFVGKRGEIKEYILSKSDTGCTVFSLNADILGLALENPDFKNTLNRSDLNIPDGVGALIKLRHSGAFCERYPGIELARDILPHFKRLAIVGAAAGVAKQAAIKLKSEFIGLTDTLALDGYFSDFGDIKEELLAFLPDVVFVCMGAPKQETVALLVRELLPRTTVLALGGAADVFAGVKRRAPRLLRQLSLEWLWRIICEPKRLSRLPRIIKFMIKSEQKPVRITHKTDFLNKFDKF